MELQNQLILTFLIMFVVLYIIFNMNNLKNGDIFGNDNDIKKPLLIALIGTLLYYLYMTWDKDNELVPTYSIANNRVGKNSSNKISFMNNLIPSEESIFLDPRFLGNKQYGNIY